MFQNSYSLNGGWISHERRSATAPSRTIAMPSAQALVGSRVAVSKSMATQVSEGMVQRHGGPLGKRGHHVQQLGWYRAAANSAEELTNPCPNGIPEGGYSLATAGATTSIGDSSTSSLRNRPRSRSELPTTSRLLHAIAIAAIAGVITPKAASGRATAL